MMSTLEASQDIRSLPPDDEEMKDIVDDVPFTLDNHKEFQKDSPSNDKIQESPREASPDPPKELEPETFHDELPDSDDDDGLNQETTPGSLEKDSLEEEEISRDSPKDEKLLNAEKSPEDISEPDEIPESNGSLCEVPEIVENIEAEEKIEKECHPEEDISDEKEQEDVPVENGNEEPDEIEKEDSENMNCEENNIDEDSVSEVADDFPAKIQDNPEISLENTDEVTKSSEIDDDFINLDDMLKDIGVDNPDSVENDQEDQEIQEEVKNSDEKSPEMDDDIEMTDLEASVDKPSSPQEAAETPNQPEELSEDQQPIEEIPDDILDEDLTESKDSKENDGPVDEIVNLDDDSIDLPAEESESKPEEEPTVEEDASEQISELNEEKEELKELVKETHPEEPVTEADEVAEVPVVEETKDPEPSVEEDEPPAEPAEEEDPKIDEEVKVSESDDVLEALDASEIEKPADDLSNDDVLIIDDEPDQPADTETPKEIEEEVEKKEEELPEEKKESDKSDEKEEVKEEEEVKVEEAKVDTHETPKELEDKGSDMEVEEDLNVTKEEGKESKEEVKEAADEPIAIDDDDLSMDDKEEEVTADMGKKRPSLCSEMSERTSSVKRMKLSDESEKDTDTDSKSSLPEKKDEDLQDSSSRQSEKSSSSFDFTTRMTLRKDTRKKENEEKSQAEKDVGSLLTPLPKKVSMEFMTKFKKPFQDMSHSDLEDFVLQKIAESITHKSEYTELRKKVEKQEEMINFYRTKLRELGKNFQDLEVVYRRVQRDLDNRNAGYVQIPKITRAVGLQVSVSTNRKQPSLAHSLSMPPEHNRVQPASSAEINRRPQRPVQRFTQMRPPISEAEQRQLEAQEQRQRQEMQQQVQQKLINSTSSSNPQRNVTSLVKPPLKPPQKIVPAPQNAYVVKRTALARTSTVTSTVVTKSATMAGQPQQRVNMAPASSMSSQQSQMHKVAVPPTRSPQSVISPAKKQQVVVDLTDEDERPKPLSVVKPASSSATTLLNGGLPALVAIPSSTTNKSTTTKYVMVQQVNSTNGQMSKPMPNKYGNRIQIPIAPKPSNEGSPPVRQLMTQQQQQQSIIRRPIMSTSSTGSTIVQAGGGMQQTQQRQQIRIVNTTQHQQRNHPAPLPAFQNPPSQFGMKRIPTRPVIRIKNDEKQGIVISWTMDDLTDDHEEIRDYQIYAYQETSSAPSTENWRLVGDVKSMMLPMAVTLSQFQEGQRYWFAVRARDIHDRCGLFSVPRTW
ncbi:hypothetical protein DMENIID0001_168160 [Sergentomyia squamirostris]